MNKEKYHLWDFLLIQYIIVQSNIIIIVWKTVRKISNKILGVKGLTIVLRSPIIRYFLGADASN